MRKVFKSFKLKQEFDRIKFLQWGHFLLVVTGYLMQKIFSGYAGIGFLGSCFILIYYWFHFKTVKKLYYSYWTFTFFLALFLLVEIFQSIFLNGSMQAAYCFLLALVILGVQIYTLLSPLYYPRISWWEYDFRYRHDLKIKVLGKEELDGRLTDLRRGAGCVVLFDDFSIGEILKMRGLGNHDHLNLTAEIMSKRQYSIGRGISYGVKFKFEDEAAKKNFKSFSRLWKKEKSSKIKKKFIERSVAK